MDAMQRGTAEEELLFIHRYKSLWILKTTGLVPGFGWLWLWGHDASDTSTSRDSCLRKIAGGDFTTRYAAHHELLWILNNSNELWCYRLKISWAARTSLHQEEAPRVVASWNCCNCGLRVAPGDVEVEHGGTLLWEHGVTWTKANGKKSLCPYGRRYAHNVTLTRLKCCPEKHLPELNALRGAIGRVLRTFWSLRTFPEVWISTVSSKTVAATAMTFTWHGCAQGIPGEMRTGNMIHFEKHSTWSWKVWIDNQSRWRVMDWQLMAKRNEDWRTLLDAIWCHRLFGPFAADDSLNKMLWKSCGARECELNTNDGRESIHCKRRCV